MGVGVAGHRHARRQLPATTIVITLLLCSLAWGAGDVRASSVSPSPRQPAITLRVGTMQEPDSLNPLVGMSSASWLVWGLNYDVLVGIDPTTMSPQRGDSSEGLATDWTTSEDGKTWTFTLRHDATWQDTHEPVTAEDVAFTYNLVIKTAPAPLAGWYETMQRATALDDYTLRLDCSRPTAGLLYNLNYIFILPQHLWREVPAGTISTSYANTPPIVGSGPFQTVTLKRGAYVELIANKSYGRGAPQVDRVLFEMYTNKDSMVQDLKVGALDACQGVLYGQLKALQSDPSLTAQPIPTNGFYYLALNSYVPPPGGRSSGHPALRDSRFRQALQWAIDRQKLCDLALNGHGRLGDTVITPEYFQKPDWHWTPLGDAAYDFDLAKAGGLLDAAGYADTNADGFRDFRDQPIRLRLVAAVGSSYGAIAAKLIAGWFRDLGLQIDQQTLESSALNDRIYNTVNGKPDPDYDMFISGWYNPLDPGGALAYFTTAQIGGLNDSGYSDLEYDRLFALQAGTVDVAERKRVVDRMQQIIYEQSPYVVLDYFDDAEVWNTADWAGWQRVPTGSGSVFNTSTFLSVHPKASGLAATDGARGLVWVAGIAGIVVVGAAMFFVLRSRRRNVEEQPFG